MVLWILLAGLLQQADPPEPCPPCGGPGQGEVSAIRAKLAEAFQLSMDVTSCVEEASFETCRKLEVLLIESFDALATTLHGSEGSGAIECVACDPAPYVFPLLENFDAVADLLVNRGYDEFRGRLARMRQDMELWRGYSCCGATRSARAKPRENREMSARAALDEKCGPTFQRNRQGLRQVVRMPDDRDGCYQSRACRAASQYNGQLIEAGFWTYDGEYWYIWAERLTPRGDWVTCNP